IKFIQNSFKEKDIKIKVITQNEKIFVMANSFLLDVFENLLHNAVKFNINFVIEISIRILSVQIEGKNYIQLEFSDNGIGISDDRKESIFQRADQENKSVHGMGIGLSLVKKIISSYNGSIWVDDLIPGDYSQGSIFFVQIPEKS
ncbi:MAG: sensor histidine kinase, partial [Candidatus Helarchaeota archaeon]